MTFAVWKKRLLVGAVAGATLSCSFIMHARQKPATVATAAFDGETLVRGIYFGQGPAAGLLPASRYAPPRTSSPVATELTALENRITARLRHSDPAFFDHFAGELRSGDVMRVDRALSATAQRIKTLSDEEGYVPGKMADRPTWIWLGVGYWIAYNPGPDAAMGSTLRRTMLAEALVRQLTPSTI